LIGKALAKVFGTSNEREIKRLRPLVDQVIPLSPSSSSSQTSSFGAKTTEFRARIKERTQEADNEIARLSAEMRLLPTRIFAARLTSGPSGGLRRATGA